MADISKINLDSTNPSSPVYNIKDELARFERISYTQWQQMTPEQQAAKPYYIYDYPSERIINAENVGYDNTESGLAATQVQDAIDETFNKIKSPSQFMAIIGQGAKDGLNAVTISLTDDILNYDALWICASYYDNGVASYGGVLVPTQAVRYIYNQNAGFSFFAVGGGGTTLCRIVTRYHNSNNTITIGPELAIPDGNYYVVYGVKFRT